MVIPGTAGPKHNPIIEPSSYLQPQLVKYSRVASGHYVKCPKKEIILF